MRRHVPGARELDRVVLWTSLATGAALRFGPLSSQSFGHDEAVTVGRVLQGSLGSTLAMVPESERTPYLYYLLAWVWTRMTGEGEFGVRSLSALFGTLVIPVAYLVGRALAGRRAGVIAALLVAVNPFLVYYSGEARAYALLSLFAAVSVLGLVHALKGGGRKALLLWAAASAAALATHYFAAFLIAAEAVFLLALTRPRRAVVAALILPTAVGLAHLPLLIEQAGPERAPIGHPSPLRELPTAIVQFALGERLAMPGVYALTVPIGILAVWVFSALAVEVWRRGDHPAAAVAFASLATVLVPFALDLLGAEYFNGRNVIAAVVPALAFAAVVLVRGVGPALLVAGALAAGSLVLAAAIMSTDKLQRPDYRAISERLPDNRPRLLAVCRGADDPLIVYLGAERVTAQQPEAKEVVLVETAPPPAREEAAPGFRAAGVDREGSIFMSRYVADSPRPVPTDRLETVCAVGTEPGLLLQR